MESANGRDGQPGWEACSEAQLLFRQCRQTSQLKDNHSNNLVNLHPNRTNTQLATPGSSSRQSAPRWPQQLTFPMPWLCRLCPAPHAGTWPTGHHPVVWCRALTPLCFSSCAAFVIWKRTMAMLLCISYFSSAYTNAQNCLWTACGKGCYLRQQRNRCPPKWM